MHAFDQHVSLCTNDIPPENAASDPGWLQNAQLHDNCYAIFYLRSVQREWHWPRCDIYAM